MSGPLSPVGKKRRGRAETCPIDGGHPHSNTSLRMTFRTKAACLMQEPRRNSAQGYIDLFFFYLSGREKVRYRYGTR